jgi:hypothetical protein
LALVKKDSESRSIDRIVEICVLENDERTFATISRVKRLRFRAASTAKRRPVRVDPVKVIIRTRG